MSNNSEAIRRNMTSSRRDLNKLDSRCVEITKKGGVINLPQYKGTVMAFCEAIGLEYQEYVKYLIFKKSGGIEESVEQNTVKYCLAYLEGYLRAKDVTLTEEEIKMLTSPDGKTVFTTNGLEFLQKKLGVVFREHVNFITKRSYHYYSSKMTLLLCNQKLKIENAENTIVCILAFTAGFYKCLGIELDILFDEDVFKHKDEDSVPTTKSLPNKTDYSDYPKFDILFDVTAAENKQYIDSSHIAALHKKFKQPVEDWEEYLRSGNINNCFVLCILYFLTGLKFASTVSIQTRDLIRLQSKSSYNHTAIYFYDTATVQYKLNLLNEEVLDFAIKHFYSNDSAERTASLRGFFICTNKRRCPEKSKKILELFYVAGCFAGIKFDTSTFTILEHTKRDLGL